ncbi:MAG: ATP-dependent ligase [Frankiales bacterium]|nr:ATP-dependent ligase [Frankiales bacterium]
MSLSDSTAPADQPLPGGHALLGNVVAASDEVAATSSRTAKIVRLAALLTGLPPADVRPAVSWLTGELTQRQIGVGFAALRVLPVPSTESRLYIAEVERQLTAIGATSGAGSQGRRRQLLDDLFGAATAGEQRFLRKLLSGDLRQGALAGVMTDAVARAYGLPLTGVRRAAMLRGDLGEVAYSLSLDGPGALKQFHLEVGRPISPMLAQTATSTDDALIRMGGTAALEWKLDGARIQIHRSGNDVALFTRTLDDVTARMPEVVQAVRSMTAHDLVADGEVIALGPSGRPCPFQQTASRVGSRATTSADGHEFALTAFVFDILHRDGVDLLDEPAAQRHEALQSVVPAAERVPRIVTDDPAIASGFLAEALERGHEGVVVKSLTAPYEAGRRGSGWLKVKPVRTLDLVVLAVEWGSGRRTGLLSNIHLGARDANSDQFVMLGKTFKGMTDAMLRWQTDRFQELAVGPLDGWVVQLRPAQVVEIAFDGVQRSSRYPGGVALRFARVLRYRDDKTAAEADTLDAVRALLL